MNRMLRRTRFENRVDLERDFLTRVNDKFGSTAPLAGMTRAAIESWAARAKPFSSDRRIKRIAKILLEASVRAELVADNSRDVFEPERRPNPDSLSQLRTLLGEAMIE
jgi:hypothetical protein